MCIKRTDIYTCWYMYVYSWITLLYTWNQHSIVNQLYFNKKGKLCHWNREELPERERGKRKNLGNRFLQEKQNGQHQTLPGCLVNCRVRLFVTPGTVPHQAPLSMGFSRQEYWSGLPCPSPDDLPHPGIQPRSPRCRQMLYHLSHLG